MGSADSEADFLRQLSDDSASAVLLSTAIRWGLEGVLDNKADLPALAVRLQALIENTLSSIEARRRHLRRL